MDIVFTNSSKNKEDIHSLRWVADEIFMDYSKRPALLSNFSHAEKIRAVLVWKKSELRFCDIDRNNIHIRIKNNGIVLNKIKVQKNWGLDLFLNTVDRKAKVSRINSSSR